MLLSVVALVLLPCLMWAAMEFAYYRDLRYLRRCVHVKTVRLITYWPGMEEWRLATERLANEQPLAVPEILPENAQWQEPDILPEAITMETEPEEPLNVVNITAALESGHARDEAELEPLDRGGQTHLLRKGRRVFPQRIQCGFRHFDCHSHPRHHLG